jgi:hypothetical protein
LENFADNRDAGTAGFFRSINARPVTADETGWFVRQSLLSPTYAMSMLLADMLVCDYRAEAKQMDSKLPVLYVLSEPNVEKAMPWIKANTPNAATFTIKRHMSFWSEPKSFNAGLEAFLTKLK